MSELAIKVGEILTARSLTIASAESCTGGLIGDWLTNISGSSRYYLGGFVVYSNEAKMQLVQVQEQTLIDYGAVSEQTAGEMARGAQAVLNTDLALAVTGIAGPTGGTDEKPVGLTYIALAAKDNLIVNCFVWTGNRIENKQASATAALQMVIDYLA